MFKRMVALRDQCTCTDADEFLCAACSELDDLDAKLRRQLIKTPWGGSPTIVWPDHKPCWPQGTLGREWETHDGPALYRALAQAAGVAV